MRSLKNKRRAADTPLGPVDPDQLSTAQEKLGAQITEALEQDEGSRKAAIQVLSALREFLVSSTALGDRGAFIAAPLWRIEQAFHELDDGIVNPMLLPKKQGRGAPRLSEAERLRRLAAGLAMEHLMWLGNSKTEAARYVARRLKPQDFSKRGQKPITKQTVIDWYDEYVNDDVGSVLGRPTVVEDGPIGVFVDGTFDEVIKRMVEIQIDIARGRTVAIPFDDFIQVLRQMNLQGKKSS